MAVKLTKNELKVQKDRLKQFQRYLPTLQLKKQHQQTTLENADYSLYFVSRPEMNTRGQYFVYPVTMPNHLLTARECAVRNQFTTAARALLKKQNKGVAERLIPVE